jgi:hypothetical protein
MRLANLQRLLFPIFPMSCCLSLQKFLPQWYVRVLPRSLFVAHFYNLFLQRDSYLRLLHEVVDARAKNDPSDLLATGDFSDALDDSDEKTLVAMNVLQTLETLLRSISTAPPIVAQLETILMPVLSLTIQHEFIGEYDTCQNALKHC